MGLHIFTNPCFGPNEPGLCSSCYRGIRAWHGPHFSFRLASGILDPVLYPHQLPPSPCVRTEWARAMINPLTVVISMCLLRYELIKPDRRHTWCVNDGPLGFALVFHTPFVFPYFLSTSSASSSSGPLPFFFFLFSVLVLRFLLDFHLSILVLGLFLAFFFFHLVPRPAASPSCRVSFDWYGEALGFDCLDFVYTVCLRHGSKTFFFFAYRR